MPEQEPPKDHVPPPEEPLRDDRNDIETNVKSRSTWLRLVFMIVVFALYAVSRVIVFAVVILQFLYVLFSGSTNPKLAGLGQSLAAYTYQIIRYLTFNSDDKPYPFDLEWPPGVESD